MANNSVKTILNMYDRNIENLNVFLRYIQDLYHKECKNDLAVSNRTKANLQEVLKQRPAIRDKLIECFMRNFPGNPANFAYFAKIALGKYNDHILSVIFEPCNNKMTTLLDFLDPIADMPMLQLKTRWYIFCAAKGCLSEDDEKDAVSLKEYLTLYISSLPPKYDELAIELIDSALNKDTQLKKIFDTQRGLFSTSVFSNKKMCLSVLEPNLYARKIRVRKEEEQEREKDGQKGTVKFFYSQQNPTTFCSEKNPTTRIKGGPKLIETSGYYLTKR